MATATEMIERVTACRDNLQATIVESIEETAAEYVELNTQQLYHGLDGTGRKIGPQYAREEYAVQKNQMNQLPGFGTPDLNLTGAFYRGYGVRVEGSDVIKDSDVPYADKLFEKYGNEIGELDDENHEEYTDNHLAPAFLDRVREQTGLL